ncbi:hypothetical protein ElyMa_002277600 [Elysia marginata]|uniref:Uncharacterized protein n=1 Tax=Elysia marginata TaxID=1093978 RepID=A0AAV4G184_9GAST|nr:hypothetical protein ElyMa_002277600 [Elysia marginata]
MSVLIWRDLITIPRQACQTRGLLGIVSLDLMFHNKITLLRQLEWFKSSDRFLSSWPPRYGDQPALLQETSIGNSQQAGTRTSTITKTL